MKADYPSPFAGSPDDRPERKPEPKNGGGSAVNLFRENLVELKRELGRVRGLERTDILERVQQLETVVEALGDDMPILPSAAAPIAPQQLQALGERLGRAGTPDELMQQAVSAAASVARTDRVVVYRFSSSDGETGTVVAEDIERGWTPMKGRQLPATTFGRDRAADYLGGGLAAIDDAARDRLTPYQIQLLEQYQVRSSLALPLRAGEHLWGLLVVQRCQAPAPWDEATGALLYQLAGELSLQLARFDFSDRLEQQRERAKTVATVIDRIRGKQRIEEIFESATQEVRRVLAADRVGVYKFNEDWSGGFVAEAVTTGWTPVVMPSGEDPAGKVANDCTIRQLGPNARATDTDTYLKDTTGGGYAKGQRYSVVSDIYEMGFSRCYLDQLEKYECRAYINVPVFLGDKLWGLLAVYQNSGPRNWQDTEIELVLQIAEQLGVALQQAANLDELKAQATAQEQAAERERAKGAIVAKIRQSQDISSIFDTTTQEVRRVLAADRVGVYKFNEDWSGGFVAEAVTAGWTPLFNTQGQDPAAGVKNDCSLRQLGEGTRPTDTDTYLKDTTGGGYAKGQRYSVVSDIHEMGFSRCYLDQLEKYECRAYINVPVFLGDKLWGLLAVYQNSGPRNWQDTEIELVLQIAEQLGVALQQAANLDELKAQATAQEQAAERERAKAAIVAKIRQSQNIRSIFDTTTQEVRRVLAADRVGVYKFNEDWSGGFIAEAVTAGWTPLFNTQGQDPAAGVKNDCSLRQLGEGTRPTDTDTYLKDTTGGGYAKGQRYSVVSDIYEMGFSSCYMEQLKKYECRAYINVPVFLGDKLWGLLAVYQNSGPRNWQDGEIDLMLQVGEQLGVALQQADYLEQILQRAAAQERATGLERTKAAIITKIRDSKEVDAIFSTATQEMRRALSGDRAVVYQFNPDMSGQVVAEAVAAGWNALLVEQTRDAVLSGDRTGNDRCLLRKWSDSNVPDADTYLQETQGGRYARGQKYTAVDDIYTQGFPPCYIESLEKYQARAYIIAPILQGKQLWGLLGIYQNSGTRAWEQGEIEATVQVADQLAIALEQAEYLTQIQAQSQQLAESVAREKAAKEQLQSRAIDLLRAVGPVLKGDLTARLPISPDEIGTIADAYNNTLQSLREIVVQVQEAAQQVTLLSQQNDGEIGGMSSQAQQQSQAIVRAVSQVESMAGSTQDVAQSARAIDDAVKKSDETVAAGDKAMDRAVGGIEAIREVVSQTSRNIRDLGESSQKISRVVNLISDFSRQTQLLSLNASIEATRAGEYGRGFAVVADEVRSLARQSADATKEIEDLVTEIRNQTSEAIKVTEVAISQVSAGTNLVQAAREELNAIAAATHEIGKFVVGIANTSAEQLQRSEAATQTMQEVAAIAAATSERSVALSESFKESLATAARLQSAIEAFKI